MTDDVRYRIPETTIDGRRLPRGTEVGLKILAVTGTGADVTDRTLRICDWAGPWPEPHDPVPNPDPIPQHVLEAAARAISWQIARNFDLSVEDPTPEDMARAALEAAARLINTAGEASRLALGIARLDVEKLARAGDALADLADNRDAPAEAFGAVPAWRRLRELYGPRP